MTHDDPIARFAALFERAGTGRARSITPPCRSAPAAPTASRRCASSCCTASTRAASRSTRTTRAARASDIAANPRAALTFYWPWLNEQVRAEGTLARIAPEESDAYFATRERGRQLGAWASAQSRPIASREALMAQVAEVEARFAGRDVPRPPHWGGYRLTPARIEFWKDGAFRLHDRFVYERSGDGWTVTRLSP